ncbi:tyrosine-protein phosphatase [Cryptosporangium arvum]|uniref:Protein tyrosine/serine phosphatase n=1 Tax=Cryptosporangium arvum DSM 44712 TaxID=927661 RepID=A0A010Z331_9ACTN|nr:tyrosine-protein phosphatase [Cryptosporangium arvum]EXG81813.1 protein tyrosine/serine phosphatase [Cryptosporangium arvum DSM 44712]
MTAATTRAVPLPGTYNVRDAGGYATAGGGSVRRGLLIRADGLSGLDDEGRAQLAALGVRTVIDLREGAEVEVAPDALGDLPIRYRHLPAFAGVAAQERPRSLQDAYHLMVDECGDALAAVIPALAEPGALPAVVHCTAGKDRTGVVIAIVHALLGVGAADVEADYAATARNLSTGFADKIRATMPPGEHTDAMLAEMLACPPELIRATLARIGDVEQYLTAHGLPPGAVAGLRAALLDRP